MRRSVSATLAVGVLVSGVLAAGVPTATANGASTEPQPRVAPVGNQIDSAFLVPRAGPIIPGQLRRVVAPLRPRSSSAWLQHLSIVGPSIVTSSILGRSTNVELVRYNLRGRAKGWMQLRNVGHGGMAAWHKGTDLVVFVEANADRPGPNGRGRAIARIDFTSGRTLSTRHLASFTPAPGATHVWPSIDPLTRTLNVRYRLAGNTYINRYDLDAAVDGRYELVERDSVGLPCHNHSRLQSWSISGDFAYCFEGGVGTPAYASWLNRETLETGRHRIRVDRFTEAESVSVANLWGKPRLVFGLHSKARTVVKRGPRKKAKLRLVRLPAQMSLLAAR